MIIYSVTVSIDKDAHEEWLNWMKVDHIPKVMATGFFKEYRILRVISHQQEEDSESYNIQYECESMADLHRYQTQHAAELQKEHTDRYEGKFAAFRTLLEKL